MSTAKSTGITLGTILRGVLIVGLIVFVIVYVKFQARNLIQGPTISLLGTYEVVQNNQKIVLEGTAKNIVNLTLNGRNINTDEKGNFVQTVYLEKGYTILTLYAEDRFGRPTSLRREYVYVGKDE